MQITVRDSSNSSRVASAVGAANSSCYVAPSWTDTGLQAVDIVVGCGGSLCPVLLDFRTSCSAGELAGLGHAAC